jgi:hypothetical protein
MSPLPRLQRSLLQRNSSPCRFDAVFDTTCRGGVLHFYRSFRKGGLSLETTKPTAGGGAVGFVGYGGPSGRRRGHPFRQSREEVTLSKIPDLRITQLS